MEAKHTPGPWHFGEFELYPGAGLRFNISQAEGATYTPNYSDVAQTIAGEDLIIQEANARLIAAAPELLAALQTIGTHVMTDSDGDDVEVLFGNMEKIAAAIAKATS